jgi:hypothetical protein
MLVIKPGGTRSTTALPPQQQNTEQQHTEQLQCLQYQLCVQFPSDNLIIIAMHLNILLNATARLPLDSQVTPCRCCPCMHPSTRHLAHTDIQAVILFMLLCCLVPALQQQQHAPQSKAPAPYSVTAAAASNSMTWTVIQNTAWIKSKCGSMQAV